MAERICTCWYMGDGDLRPDHSPDCALKQQPATKCGTVNDFGAPYHDGVEMVKDCSTCGRTVIATMKSRRAPV